jgi:hypothetical protein
LDCLDDDSFKVTFVTLRITTWFGKPCAYVRVVNEREKTPISGRVGNREAIVPSLSERPGEAEGVRVKRGERLFPERALPETHKIAALGVVNLD